MNASRRSFLQAGGALLLAFHARNAASATPASSFAPDGYLRIDPSGQVTVIVAYVEMGQGTYTSIPMLIAEELEVPLSSVRVEHAPPNERLYGNPLLAGIQATGNSNAIRGTWEPMRRAGAAARAMLVQAAALQWNVEPASCRAENGTVLHSSSGRQLEYGVLVGAAAALPVPRPESVRLKRREEFKLIGTPAKRLDLSGKVDGTAMYGIDARVPGMKIATLAISPTFGGRLRKLDDTAAKAVPGVRQIVQLNDAVAVVADHMWAAKQGLAALQIVWDSGSHGAVSTASIVADMKAASAGSGAVARQDGDFEKAHATAATRHEAVYEIPFLAHATMEPMNCTVHVRKDRCDVWVGTQVLARAQAAAAKVAGLPVESVTVHNHLLGGGFGRRLEVDGIVRAVQVAKHVDGPVKVVYTREEDIQHDMYRPYFYDRLTAGLDANGMPVAWRHRITGSSIISRWYPPIFQNGWDPETVDGAVNPPYTLPNMLVEYVRHEPPGIPTAFWRGVGPTHNVFMVESFIDELAALARKDPLPYRRALLAGNPRARRVLDLAAEKARWGERLASGAGRGVALHQAFGSYLAQVAEIEVATSGEVRVRRVVCAMDCGTIVNPDTVRAQMESGTVFGLSAALHGEITLKEGRVEQNNFTDYRVLRISEMPAIEVHLVDSGEAPGGVGETATSCVMPALTNAIFAATGKRIRKLPVAEQAVGESE
jgi:isoquinoline 1-oxidoreductase subunit beta